MKKLFVIRKFVRAENAQDAIKKEKALAPDGVWIDDKWAEENIQKLESGKKSIAGFER